MAQVSINDLENCVRLNDPSPIGSRSFCIVDKSRLKCHAFLCTTSETVDKILENLAIIIKKLVVLPQKLTAEIERSEQETISTMTNTAKDNNHSTVMTCPASPKAEKVFYINELLESNGVPEPPDISKLLNQKQSTKSEYHHFDFDLEIQEKSNNDDDKWASVPFDKVAFKLRKDTKKQVIVRIRQKESLKPLKIDRIFGMLMCPGRNLRESDMHLLEFYSNIDKSQAEVKGLSKHLKKY